MDPNSDNDRLEPDVLQSWNSSSRKPIDNSNPANHKYSEDEDEESSFVGERDGEIRFPHGDEDKSENESEDEGEGKEPSSSSEDESDPGTNPFIDIAFIKRAFGKNIDHALTQLHAGMDEAGRKETWNAKQKKDMQRAVNHLIEKMEKEKKINGSIWHAISNLVMTRPHFPTGSRRDNPLLMDVGLNAIAKLLPSNWNSQPVNTVSERQPTPSAYLLKEGIKKKFGGDGKNLVDALQQIADGIAGSNFDDNWNEHRSNAVYFGRCRKWAYESFLGEVPSVVLGTRLQCRFDELVSALNESDEGKDDINVKTAMGYFLKEAQQLKSAIWRRRFFQAIIVIACVVLSGFAVTIAPPVAAAAVTKAVEVGMLGAGGGLLFGSGITWFASKSIRMHSWDIANAVAALRKIVPSENLPGLPLLSASGADLSPPSSPLSHSSSEEEFADVRLLVGLSKVTRRKVEQNLSQEERQKANSRF